MTIKDKRIGVGMTGSFCTYARVFPELENLVNAGAQVQTIFSKASQSINSRFGKAEDFMNRAQQITSQKPILKIETAEPIGPNKLFDIMVIMPCTGNTIAKLANGITDDPVLMAAKAHLRNENPLVLSISSNDALGMNMKNIGLLLNSKNIYFVPFGQDSPENKPNSLVAEVTLLIPTLVHALEGKQLQPILVKS